MATIKERIEDVTDDVMQGKMKIINAINNKNARNVSILDTDFSVIADGVNQLNIEQIPTPTINWDINSKTLTLSNTMSDATIQYKLSSSSSWITYTSPVTLNDFGDYDFMAYKDGSVDSQTITQNIIGILPKIYIDTIQLENGCTTTIRAKREYEANTLLGQIKMNGYTGGAATFNGVFLLNDGEYLEPIRVEYIGDNSAMQSWIDDRCFITSNLTNNMTALIIFPRGNRVSQSELFQLICVDKRHNEYPFKFTLIN